MRKAFIAFADDLHFAKRLISSLALRFKDFEIFLVSLSIFFKTFLDARYPL